MRTSGILFQTPLGNREDFGILTTIIFIINVRCMPITVGHIIAQSIDLYKKHWKKYLQYVVLTLAPFLILVIVPNGFIEAIRPSQFTFAGVGVLFACLFIIAWICSTWFSISFLKDIADTYQTQTSLPIKEQLIASKPLLLPAIIASILVGLSVLGGFILLIIPGVIFSIWFAFSIHAVAIDGHGSTDALRTSKALIQGRWWHVMWLLAVPAFLFGISAWVLQYLFLMPGEFANNQFITGVGEFIGGLVSIVIAPLTTAAPTILYLELKSNPLAPPVLPPTAT
jgi:hypothetical protein